jgi:histidinol phosphatase-like PHP family hydrolase
VALANIQLSELLARSAAEHDPKGTKGRALRRAARAALTWDVEAADLAGSGRSLTELRSVGPWLATVIDGLLEAPPADPEPLRRGFLTRTAVDATLATAPAGWRPLADLQMHTTWSDGHSSLEEMVATAELRGYSHIAITDHSQGLAIAGGMDEAELAAQGRAIAMVNEDLGRRGAPMRVLRSIEMNLSPEGEGDMDPAALAELDLVLGAFHSKLRWTEDQTPRYLAALRSPTVDVLAHPRGRMFNFRMGLSCDWAAVCAEAARLDKAVEIDGYPDRQDLDVATLAAAREAGCRISLGSDSHHVVDLPHIDFAVAAALQAGIQADRILNLMNLDELLAWRGQRVIQSLST